MKPDELSERVLSGFLSYGLPLALLLIAGSALPPILLP